MITKQQVNNAIDEGLINGNGHSIMDAQYYLEHGFDCESLIRNLNQILAVVRPPFLKMVRYRRKLKGFGLLTFIIG